MKERDSQSTGERERMNRSTTVSVDGVADFEAELLVSFTSFGWAVLAHETPCGAHCAAAIGFSYLHQTVGARGASSIHQLTETITSAAICSITIKIVLALSRLI